MKLLLTIVFLLTSAGVRAQELVNIEGIEAVERALSPQIEVKETPEVELVMRAIDSRPRAERRTVYAVRLFSDNSQNAGANAREAAARFSAAYEGIEPRVDYQTPYFRVTVGRFIDRTDAVALCGKVAGSFPKAFVIEENIRLE